MKYKFYIYVVLSFTFFLVTCSETETSIETKKSNELKKREELTALNKVNALPLSVKYPIDNPRSEDKIKLGKLLFFDPILSGGKDVACATCHHPNNGYAEFRDISIGVNGVGFSSKRRFKQPNSIPFLKRNAHTILNTAYNGIDINNNYTPHEAPMFWDLRVRSLETQAIEPIKTFEEMKGPNFTETEILVELIDRLKANADYQNLFKNAFTESSPITIKNIGKAIAAFERTLVTNNSRFDQYMRGDRNAISLSEKEGFETFKKVGCVNCHNGAMFSDYKIHVLGVPKNEKLKTKDSGFETSFGFRTPSLRNLHLTAPYMHNGSIPDLLKVLEFYEDISVGVIRNPDVSNKIYDPLVKKLQLEVKDMRPIISFLNTLNDKHFDKTIPTSVPSGLPVGGNIQ